MTSFRLGLPLLFVAAWASAGFAGTKTWNNSQAAKVFSDANNWTPAGALAVTDDLVFGAGYAISNDLAAQTVNTLTFNGATGGTTIAASAVGNVLTVNAGITSSNTTGFDAITAPLKLGANQTYTLNAELDVNGPIDLGPYTLTLNSAVWSYIQGAISGTGALIKTGAANVTFAGPGATFTGGTTIMQGLVHLSHGSGVVAFPGPVMVAVGASIQLDNPEQIGDGALVTVDGSLFLVGKNETLGALAGSGGVTLGGATFTVGGSASSTFSGVISGTGGFVRAGTGTLTLTGTNTLTATTTVSAGTLLVNGNDTTSPVTLSGGTLGGTGTVGNVTQSGGVLAPGAGAPGKLTTGNVSLSAGMLGLRLNGTTAGTTYDQLKVVGTVSLGNLPSVIVGYVPAVNTTFTIIDNDGADAVTGTFTGLVEGAMFMSDGGTFQVSYVGGTGNDVTLKLIAYTMPPDMTTLPDLAEPIPSDDLGGPIASDDLGIADDQSVVATDLGKEGDMGSSGGCSFSPKDAPTMALVLVLAFLAFALRRRPTIRG